MILSQDQKQDLQSLIEHRGFKLLEEMVADLEKDLFTQFKTIKLWDEEVGLKLNWAQNQLAGAELLISNARAYSIDVKEKKL